MEEGGDHILGTISGILIVPDTGKIEGFYVNVSGILGWETMYCSAIDIVRWGTRVYINSRDSLAAPADRIRLQALLEDPRTVLGQRIRSEAGHILGRCKDVQFNTDSMHIEWIFPRKWWRWGVALPVSDIIEVRNEAIIVKNPLAADYINEDVKAKTPAMVESTVASTYKNTP